MTKKGPGNPGPGRSQRADDSERALEAEAPLGAVVLHLTQASVGLIIPDLARVIRPVAGDEHAQVARELVAGAGEQDEAGPEELLLVRPGDGGGRGHRVAAGVRLVGPGAVHFRLELAEAPLDAAGGDIRHEAGAGPGPRRRGEMREGGEHRGALEPLAVEEHELLRIAQLDAAHGALLGEVLE